MTYDFLITGSGYFDYSTSFQTTLSGEINIFGLKLDLNYDISLAKITSISGDNFTWELPFHGDQIPNIGYNYIPASALFTNTYGDFQEISAQIIAYKRPVISPSYDYDFLITCSGDVDYIASFQTSLPEPISNFGLKIGGNYDISEVEIFDISGNVYNWEIPFQSTDFPTDGYHDVNTSAMFIDVSGNFQEISGSLVAYKMCDVVVDREYYVQLQANINADLYQNENGDFGLRGAVINKNEETYDLCYNLPTGSGTMKISSLDIVGLDGSKVGSFDVKVDIHSLASGELTASAYFDGVSATESVEEDSNVTQIVYWDIEPRIFPSSISLEGDVLSATIDTNLAEELYSDKLRAIEALYTKSTIASWEMVLLDVLPGPGSILDRIVDRSDSVRSLPDFFEEGESITLAFGKNLQLSLEDLEGNPLEIIPSTTIYAVITQNSNAPPINP